MILRRPAAHARRRPTVTLLVGALLVLAACTDSGGGASLGRGAEEPPPPPRAPLTGLPVDAAVLDRPAVTIKVDNSAAGRPQAGLDQADVVFEAIVEGGVTRFLAIFHSTDADAGPIRSVRPADPAIVTPFGGVVAFSGGIDRFVDAVRAAGLTAVDETAAGSAMRRRRDRSAPHNLYGRSADLRAKAAQGAKAPPAFGPFLAEGEEFAPAGASPVDGVDLVVGRTQIGYTWDPQAGAWRRTTNGTPHVVESGAQIAPTTVIVQFVANTPTGEVDTTGSPVTEAQVVGQGSAFVFAAGKVVAARWSKPTAGAMTTFTDDTGRPIALPPGRTWIELPNPTDPITPRTPPPPSAPPVP